MTVPKTGYLFVTLPNAALTNEQADTYRHALEEECPELHCILLVGATAAVYVPKMFQLTVEEFET